MQPLINNILHVAGSFLFLFASLWNIATHVGPVDVFYVYAAGSACFLTAALVNLTRRFKP